MIRQMETRDMEAVTQLHSEALRIGFLSTLGEDFLGIIYEGITASDLGIIFVYEEDEKVTGYIAGSMDTQRLFREIYRRKLPRLAGNLAFKVVRQPGIIRNLVRSSRYPGMAGDSVPAELLSIAVVEDARGKGIGSALVEALIEYFRKHGVDRFKVSVDQRLPGVDKFYESLGFELSNTIDIYEKKMDIYVFDIGRREVASPEKTSDSTFFGNSEWDRYWEQEIDEARGTQKLIKVFRTHFGDEYIRQLKSFIQSGDARILEIGCGTAYCTQKLGDNGFMTYALDYSPQAARYWDRSRGIFLIADGFNIPFKSDSFDVVWNAGVLEHFDNPRDMLLEMARVCKPQGTICIFVPYLFDFTAHLKLYGEENIFTRKKLRELFSVLDDVGVKVLYRTGGMIICGWGKKIGED